MTEINKVFAKYSAGEITVDDANEKLTELGSDLRLDPNANSLTDDELGMTIVSDDPSKVSGYGLVESGTGYMNKVRVENGKIVNSGMGAMIAYIFIGGRRFTVHDTTLAN